MFKLEELVKDMSYISSCLKSYEEILNLPNCQNCGKIGSCEYAPEWGQLVRYNCPLWEE